MPDSLSPDDVQTLFRLHGATTLAARVRALRTFHALSLRGLARRASLAPSAVQKIESGFTTEPHLSSLRRLAEALGTDVDTLTG